MKLVHLFVVALAALIAATNMTLTEAETKDLPLLRIITAVEDTLKDADPFFRDTDLKIHLRTYYLGKWNTNGTKQQSWASGG